MKTLIFLTLFPLLVPGQPKDIKYLVVRGHAEVLVPVKYLEIGIAIVSHGSSMKEANDNNRALIYKMFDVFKEFAIPDSDFQTLNNTSSIQDFQREPEKRFVINYTGQLMFRRPVLYDSLFNRLVSLGTVSMNINAFRNDDRARYRMLAYQRAVAAARAEAELMLKGTGQTVGKIIKLIQDNRDVFTQYDDIENLLEDSNQPLWRNQSLVTISAQKAAPTFRRTTFTESGEVTAIFEVK